MREPRKELSSEERGRIVGAYLCGTAPSTVYKTVNRYKQSGSAQPKGRPGRPKSLNDREQRALKKLVLAGGVGPLVSSRPRMATSNPLGVLLEASGRAVPRRHIPRK